MEVRNFGAGPAKLPKEVLKIILTFITINYYLLTYCEYNDNSNYFLFCFKLQYETFLWLVFSHIFHKFHL